MSKDGSEVGDEATLDERVVPEVFRGESLTRRQVPRHKDEEMYPNDPETRPLSLVQIDIVLRNNGRPPPPGAKVPHERSRVYQNVLRAREGEARLYTSPCGRHGGEAGETLLRVAVGELDRGGEPEATKAEAERDVGEYDWGSDIGSWVSLSDGAGRGEERCAQWRRSNERRLSSREES